MKQIRKRLTYANVMATIAVFLVLGGATALAAGLGKNSVGSKQLKKNSVTAAKIKKNAVTAAKISKNAVDGSKVKDGSLTGADINLGTVGTVPSAANSGAVDGNTIRSISFSGNPTVGPTQVLNLDGFTLTATCTGSDELSVLAGGPTGSRLQSAGIQSGPGGTVTNSVFDDTLSSAEPVQLLEEDDDLVVGHTEFSLGTGGRNVSVSWEAESFGASSGPHCTFTGYAIG